MTETADEPDPRERIREIESTLRMLRGELGTPDPEPRDFGDAGQDLQARAEIDARVEALENERARLRGELGEPPDDPPDDGAYDLPYR